MDETSDGAVYVRFGRGSRQVCSINVRLNALSTAYLRWTLPVTMSNAPASREPSIKILRDCLISIAEMVASCGSHVDVIKWEVEDGGR